MEKIESRENKYRSIKGARGLIVRVASILLLVLCIAFVLDLLRRWFGILFYTPSYVALFVGPVTASNILDDSGHKECP